MRITFDPVEAAYDGGYGTRYRPAVHHIMDPVPGWLKDLKAGLPKPVADRLFGMWHAQAQSTVLASWIYRPGQGGPGLFTEVTCWQDAERPPLHVLRDMCRPMDEITKGVRETVHSQFKAQEREDEKRKENTRDIAAYARKHGMEDAALDFEATGIDAVEKGTPGGDMADYFEKKARGFVSA